MTHITMTLPMNPDSRAPLSPMVVSLEVEASSAPRLLVVILLCSLRQKSRNSKLFSVPLVMVDSSLLLKFIL